MSPGLVDVKKKSSQSLPLGQTHVHGKSVDDWVELEMDAQSQENAAKEKDPLAKKMQRHLQNMYNKIESVILLL